MRKPDVAKITSAWAPLTAALVALQVYGCAVARHAGDSQKESDLLWPLADRCDTGAKFDPGLRYVESQGVTVGDVQAGKWDRLAVIPVGSVADEIKVRTALTVDGKTIQVVVALVLQVNQVNPDVAWAVLNDYENMSRFVPDILATRLISAEYGRKRVEIEGVARLLFLEFPTHTTLDVVDRPDGSVAIDSVAGNMGSMRVRGDGQYTRVDYEVLLTPDFWLPPLIGDLLIGRQITRQFEGMVAEMHRRVNGHQTQGPGFLDGQGCCGSGDIARRAC